ALFAAGIVLGTQVLSRKTAAPVSYQKVTFSRGYVQSARFGGTGRVYYSASWGDNDPQVFATELNAPGGQPIGAPPNTMLVSVSRDGEVAVLLRPVVRPHGEGVGTLARMTVGGAPREILDNVAEADWSPDGSNLAVVRAFGTRYRVEYPIGKTIYESPG